jgi:Flp pilus assembly protein TadD
MFENITLRFRSRWRTISIVIALMLAVSPTPLDTRWVSSLTRSSIALQSGQVDQALLEIETALEAEPALAGLHLLASDLAYHFKSYDQSRTHLTAAKKVYRGSEIGFCRLARNDFKSEFDDPPDHQWERLVRECPSSRKEASVTILQIFENDPDPALLPYLEVLHEANPDQYQIRRALAFLLSSSYPEQAVEHLRALSNLDPDGSELERDLILAINESSSEASPAFAFTKIGQVFASYQQWSLARLALEAALTTEPEYADALAYYGLALEQLGEDGSDPISAAVAADPQDPRALVFLAIHHQTRGEIEQARLALDKAAGLDPDNPAIAAQLGSVYAEIGDFTAATQAYLAATQLAPSDARFWLLLAGFSLEYDLDLKQIGLPAARNAISMDPGNARAYEMLGAIQLNLDQFVLAERSLQTALALDQRAPSAQYTFGLLMLAFGKRQAAEAAFSAASIVDETGQYAQLSARFLSR